MKREEKPNETPRKEKMQEALAHYDEIATKACWHRSDIPEAIRAYYASPSSATAAEVEELFSLLLNDEFGPLPDDVFTNPDYKVSIKDARELAFSLAAALQNNPQPTAEITTDKFRDVLNEIH